MGAIPNLQSYKALEVLWSFWKLQGVYSVEKYRFYQYIHAAIVLSSINGICSILFVGELFIVHSFKELLDNLSMSLCLLICGYKTIIILRTRLQIIQIRPILDQLDIRPSTEAQRSEMANVCTTCNRLTLIICFSYLLVNGLFGLMAALSGRQHLVFPVWLPYDWRVSAFRFWITWLYQNVAQFFFCVQQAANDATGPVYLNILNTHLRILMYRIESLCNDPEKSDLQKQKELIEAIEDHRLITKIFDILQGTVSYTILLQFVGSCLVICMIILDYFLYNLTLTEIFTGLFFIVAEMIEIAPCCYYSNEFMSSTDEFVNSIYSADWTTESIKFKKLMIIFMILTQKSKVIIAGKVVPVTLATFASIMKISYSLFTVASNFSKK
ncbi:odorant receptor 33a-like [Hermetia illucens]|uniref:odorant receptor 33a-like n=1 Tax=Hermetia illucens TaxID=343691 RepID=UPI0018CC0ADD|nr:odorant receptor 33a-like [Hermetia illucens]